jgi:dihydrofolate synthase/folylpolyglutamate synthase
MSFVNKKNLHIIFGCLEHKDHRSFLRNLVPVASSVSIVEIDNQPSSLVKTVALSSAKEVGWKKIYSACSIRNAIENICSQYNGLAPQVSILICGSLYLAGQALKENGVEI